MGGAVDCGVGLDNKTSPRRAAIEKAQAELRQEFDVRDERRRELEFLEKGGNPLDFELGPATSVSLQSASFTDQLAEQHVISEVKGSFVLTTSPYGDSVESSGGPGILLASELNTADNLLLFDSENDTIDGMRNALYLSSKSNVFPLDQSSQLDGSHNIKEAGDSVLFRLGAKSQSYARRNRARSSRDSGQPCSNRDLLDGQVFIREAPTDKYNVVSFVCNSKPTSPNGNVVSETMASYNQLDVELDTVQVRETETELTKVGCPVGNTEIFTLEMSHGNEVNQHSQEVLWEQDSKAKKIDNFTNFSHLKGLLIGDGNGMQDEGRNGQNFVVDTVIGVCDMKGLDSESSCSQITHSLDGIVAGDQSSMLSKVDNSNEPAKEQASTFKNAQRMPDANEVKESINSGVQVKIEEGCDSRTDLQSQSKPIIASVGERKSDDHVISGSEGKLAEHPSTLVASNCEPPEAACVTVIENCEKNQTGLGNKVHDVILEEARSIEATLMRGGELSVSTSLSDKRRKSHWDFVLEEMAWLANDFMQERVWKIAAAAQLVCCATFTGRRNLCQKQRKVAHTWANSVMQFWHSAEVIVNSDDLSGGLHVGSNSSFFAPQKETTASLEGQNIGKIVRHSLQDYAMRFLKYNRSCDLVAQAEAPATPDRTSDAGILEMPWDDQLSEESLFYTVPSGAMAAYRKFVESHWASNEKLDKTMRTEDCDTSLFVPAAEFRGQENVYEEDEGEIGVNYLPGAFEGSKSSKFTQRKRKNLLKSYSVRSYDVKSISGLPYGQCLESKCGNQQVLSTGKRASSSLNICSIPTKRIRTAARQRVVSPFGAGATGGVHIACKTDVSSGDTSSFQDEHSSLHGGSQPKRTLEVDSSGDFGKQLPFDGSEISTKPKKKKAKHLEYRNSLNSTDSGGFVISGKGSVYEQRWQLDSMGQHEQKDHSKKRIEGHHFESNANTVTSCQDLHGQQAAKKPKILKHLPDTSSENVTPVPGSIPSPVASQMSNMSNPNKLIKVIANRDRSRKNKALKMPPGQSGSGSRWSLFEDQALVVLVHDMGPNWELVSDAINTTLQFKCIFRKPKECKERHNALMDRNAGDGADSAEDSGTSQPYPSTLPGIPKGSARQLLQRLQGPMEEDTLKSHFEKIIMIWQQQHSLRAQNENQEPKQSAPAHSSHGAALTQVCPNNLNGGPLTPFDLCDTTTSSPDIISCGYQGSHASGIPVSIHQGSVAPVQSTAAKSTLQGTNSLVLGSSVPSPSGSLNATSRDVQRYAVTRPPSLPIDEQQRIQQYSQMISNRNMHQSGLSVPGGLPVGTDRGVHMLPGGNGMGMMMNRGMGMPRPGFQGIGSPGMLGMVSSGSMLSSSGVGMPSPVNMHSGAVSSQGNPMLRPRETLQMLQPGQNPDDQRKMMLQELQLQQGNSQNIAPFSNNLSTTFSSNQTVPSPVTFPAQSQQQHQMPQQSHVFNTPHHSHLQSHNHNQQQQAYILRVAKERQLQQRFMHQQQHQFAASNALPLPPHNTQPQSHHAMMPLQNNSQQQQQQQHPLTSQPVPVSPTNLQHPLTSSSAVTHHPVPLQSSQKQHINVMTPHTTGRGPQGAGALLPNQMLKQQRQRQLQQQHRHPSQVHPQQRQMTQSQQQQLPNKLMKGLGRGGSIMVQSLPIDISHANGGISTGPGNQVGEKGEQVLHLMPGQNLYPASSGGPSPGQPGKHSLAHPGGIGGQQNQLSRNIPQQQKLFSRQPPLSKQSPHLSSLQDNGNQGSQVQVPSNQHVPTVVAAQQSPVASTAAAPSPPFAAAVASPSHQQQQQQRQSIQSQHTVQRMLHQNHQSTPDAPLLQSSSPADQVNLQLVKNSHAFQMGQNTTAIPSCTDSSLNIVVPVIASSPQAIPPSQWKGDPGYNASSPTPTAHLNATTMAQPSSTGTDVTIPPSSGPGLTPPQRQYSGGLPIHGHNVGNQWQQQQQSPLPQQQQHRQATAQGGLYARPSCSGSI